MTTTELTEHYCRYATRPEWEQELHRSVRLHLALFEPGLSTRAVRAALRLVEADLCQLLLASDPASAGTPEAADTATTVVQMYQMALLSHKAECDMLRRTMPVTEFMPALHPTGGPRPAPKGGWPLLG
ncbi:MAG: hypothetical protein ACRYFZ_15980 [Janthinobacterium lividum]